MQIVSSLVDRGSERDRHADGSVSIGAFIRNLAIHGPPNPGWEFLSTGISAHCFKTGSSWPTNLGTSLFVHDFEVSLVQPSHEKRQYQIRRRSQNLQSIFVSDLKTARTKHLLRIFRQLRRGALRAKLSCLSSSAFRP